MRPATETEDIDCSVLPGKAQVGAFSPAATHAGDRFLIAATIAAMCHSQKNGNTRQGGVTKTEIIWCSRKVLGKTGGKFWSWKRGKLARNYH